MNEKKRLKQIENDRKRAFLLQFIDIQKYKPVFVDNLNFRQKVFLGCVLRGGLLNDFSAISPISEYSGKLFPTEDYLIMGFKELYFSHILRIDPSSSLLEFTPDYENNTYSFNWKNVFLYFNVTGEADSDSTISEFLNPGLWNEIYTDEATKLWKEIAYYECIDLFMFRMEAYNFSYTIGKETKAFFEDLINHFPLSQIYSIIWNGAKNAAAYNQERKVPKRQAANSVLMRMRNSADKIISGQWSSYNYKRPKECPQSLLSEYFFNSVLKICDQGWDQIPCAINT